MLPRLFRAFVCEEGRSVGSGRSTALARFPVLLGIHFAFDLGGGSRGFVVGHGHAEFRGEIRQDEVFEGFAFGGLFLCPPISPPSGPPLALSGASRRSQPDTYEQRVTLLDFTKVLS
jgi:hypothetical protein